MSDEKTTHTTATSTSGGSVALAFVVGALVVVVGILVWTMFGDGGSGDEVTISIEGAGEAIEGAVDGN